jgi:hypothetical protein
MLTILCHVVASACVFVCCVDAFYRVESCYVLHVLCVFDENVLVSLTILC